MATNLGFLDEAQNRNKYVKLKNQKAYLEALKDLKDGKYLAAGVPTSIGKLRIFLHGCICELDVRQELQFHGGRITWYIEK